MNEALFEKHGIDPNLPIEQLLKQLQSKNLELLERMGNCSDDARVWPSSRPTSGRWRTFFPSSPAPSVCTVRWQKSGAAVASRLRRRQATLIWFLC